MRKVVIHLYSKLHAQPLDFPNNIRFLDLKNQLTSVALILVIVVLNRTVFDSY